MSFMDWLNPYGADPATDLITGQSMFGVDPLDPAGLFSSTKRYTGNPLEDAQNASITGANMYGKYKKNILSKFDSSGIKKSARDASSIKGAASIPIKKMMASQAPQISRIKNNYVKTILGLGDKDMDSMLAQHEHDLASRSAAHSGNDAMLGNIIGLGGGIVAGLIA